MQPRSFGKLPGGERLKRIQASPNYHDSAFRNEVFTPMLSEDASYLKMIREAMKKHPGRAPEMPLPVVFSKSPANKEQTILTWFGHSTYLIQTAGLNLLVRSEEHTSELQSLMRISYAVFCLTKKIKDNIIQK